MDTAATPAPDFEAFAAAARAAGYDEVLERVWQPHQVVPLHGHPFALRVQVAAGEVFLGLGAEGAEQRRGPGECFELPHDAPHRERYGPEGAVFWVARRHAAAA